MLKQKTNHDAMLKGHNDFITYILEAFEVPETVKGK